MIIDRVETWACSVPLPTALSFGNFTIRSREYTAVRIATRCGLVADCIGHTRRSPVDVAVSDVLAPVLLGKDASNLGARLADLRRALLAIEADGVMGRALSLVDICLWDLRAQRLAIPVWQLLGGHPREVEILLVEGYRVAGEKKADIAARLARRIEDGYRLLKLEAAHYGDPRPIREILSAISSKQGTKFVCDLAWSWRTAHEGLAAARMWQELDLAWIEDPMPRGCISEIAFLRHHSPIPIGVGDETTRTADLDLLMDRNAVDVLRIDATTNGGFSGALPLAARAVARGFRVSFHVNPEIHQHCIFAGETADHIEMFPVDRDFDCAHKLVVNPAGETARSGRFEARSDPGTGLRLNAAALERFAYRHSLAEYP